MKSGWWIGSRMLGAGLILAGGALPAAALTVTFDPPGSPPSIATSYTEAGLTVAPDVSGFYVMLGDHDGNGSPDLENHPACCSTPYRFTYNGGAVFSVAKFDFVLNGGAHKFTSSPGARIPPGAGGGVPLPAPRLPGITHLSWP